MLLFLICFYTFDDSVTNEDYIVINVRGDLRSYDFNEDVNSFKVNSTNIRNNVIFKVFSSYNILPAIN